MEALSSIIKSISAFAWPTLFGVFLYYYRNTIRKILSSIGEQIQHGAILKWKDFELKGIRIEANSKGNIERYTVEGADQVLFQKRHEGYYKNKNLFLVHRARATDQIYHENGLPIFEISVYLIGHKSFGKTNDVKFVEYYFGQHFGISEFPYGYKFTVNNGSEGFAVKISAYGPTLCEARICFHDGTESTVNRYLDFEDAGYQFNATTNSFDIERIKNNT